MYNNVSASRRKTTYPREASAAVVSFEKSELHVSGNSGNERYNER